MSPSTGSKHASHTQRAIAMADELAKKHSVACTKEENKVRPEWEPDTNIKTIVKRLERGEPVPLRQTRYDVIADYTVDLDGMHGAAREMGEAYNQLPQAVREHLTPTDFLARALKLASIDPEQLRLELTPEPEKPAAPPATPVAPTPQKDTTA